MKTNLYRIIVVIIFSIGLYILGIYPDEIILSTLFTVSSIFLSIGLSLIITFDLIKIKNDSYYNYIKNNINNVRKTFLIYFFVITSAYLISMQMLQCKKELIYTYKINTIHTSINYSIFFIDLMFSLLLFGIFYFIINFIQLQKLKNDIDATLRKEMS